MCLNVCLEKYSQGYILLPIDKTFLDFEYLGYCIACNWS